MEMQKSFGEAHIVKKPSPKGNAINLRNQGPISMSLRTSPQTGAAIRSPYNVPFLHLLPRRKRIATSLRSSQ